MEIESESLHKLASGASSFDSNTGRQEFLLALADAIRPLRDPEAIKASASQVLGRRLRANRAFYAEIEADAWVVEGGWASGLDRLAGRYTAQTYGTRIMDTYRAGKRIVFRDTSSEPGFTREEREAHVEVGILAAIGVPLVKDGRLIAILAVHSATPRDWTTEEIALVDETAERTWAAVEQAHAESALRESEAKFRLLTESVPQLVWTCRADGSCDYLSRQWVAYTGVPEGEQLDMDWLDRVIHPEDRERTREHWFGAVAGLHKYDIEYRIRNAQGEYRWFQTRGVPLRDANGNILKWFGTCTDIEERKQAALQLQKANRDLEEFAYVASHDLQEPLRMINVFGQMLIKRHAHGDEEAVRCGNFIQDGITRMETLLRDVLAYSRITHSEGPSDFGTADLSQALSNAMADLRVQIAETGAEILIEEPLPVAVQGDTQQFAHVFQNLLSNALKYRGKAAAPAVAISAVKSPDGKQWTISVKDNGIGFDQQYAERIFGLFKRLHKDQYPGTGLGLAICQRIIERYGGRIWAESNEGQGATFFFTVNSAS